MRGAAIALVALFGATNAFAQQAPSAPGGAPASAPTAAAPSAAAPTAPTAADVEEAKKHYARGVQLYNQGADAAALAELERAYKLAPNSKVLYNLGLVELQMNDFASALRSFEQFLAESEATITPARRQEVSKRVAQLREQVATIEITVNADDADVTLDDVVVGKSPLAKALVVNPGHHKLGATKAGRAAESKVVSVAGADRSKVALVFEEAPAPLPPGTITTLEPEQLVRRPGPETPPFVSPPPERMAAPARPVPREVWIGWTATAALATGAIVTGVIALSANGDLSRAKSDGPTPGAGADRLSSRAHTFAIASDVLTGATLVAGGLSLYFTLRAKRGPAAAAIDLRAGPTDVAVHGTF